MVWHLGILVSVTVLASVFYIEKLLSIFMVRLHNKQPSSLNPLLCVKRGLEKMQSMVI